MFDRSRYEPKKLILGSLRGMVRGLESSSLSADEAVALVAWFAQVERLAVAGRTIAAAAVATSGAWREAGDRSAADWLAKQTGSTVGEARTELDLGARLAHAPATDAAFRGGALSAKQADAIASAAALDPDAESRLLAMAGSHSLQKLRDEAARVRAAADPDPGATHERIRKDRFWRKWTDRDGARCGSYRTTPEQAALLEAAAQPFVDATIDLARASGEREPFEAYAMDGLAEMAASTMHRDDRVSLEEAPARPPRGGRGRRRLRDRRELIGIVNLESLNAARWVRASCARSRVSDRCLSPSRERSSATHCCAS